MRSRWRRVTLGRRDEQDHFQAAGSILACPALAPCTITSLFQPTERLLVSVRPSLFQFLYEARHHLGYGRRVGENICSDDQSACSTSLIAVYLRDYHEEANFRPRVGMYGELAKSSGRGLGVRTLSTESDWQMTSFASARSITG
jgi:hypothetical protein